MFWKKKTKKTAHLEVKTYKNRVHEFWQWYAAHATRIYDAIETGHFDDVHQDIDEAVKKLGIKAWVFGPGPTDKGGHSFTLSGEGNIHEQFLTEYWLKHAPELDGWTFYASRQPSEINASQGIKMMGHRFSFGEVWVTPELDEERQEVDLTVWHPHFDKIKEQDRYTVLFLLLDEVLGEYGTTNWIGKINPTEDKLAHAIPISELRDFVSDLEIQKQWKKYPPTECYIGYKIPPQETHFPRSDVFTGTSLNFTLIQEYMRSKGSMDTPLDRTGADFIYISFSSRYLPKGQEVDFRSHIEDTIDAKLSQDASGQTLGGATGHERTYIDIIIYDGERSMAIIDEALKEADAPSGTSVHYFEKDRETKRVVL
ncbi:MAG: hypothetical protein ACSHYA_18210 [Opitutaceae bacterium]